MKQKIILAVLTLLAVVGALAGIKALQIGALVRAAPPGPPPETVGAAPVRSETWQSSLPAVGSIAAVEGTVVRSEVAGVVSRIAFVPGQHVAAGAVLVELDRSVEQANLRQAEADAELARLTLARSRELWASGTIARADLDQAVARGAEAEARVASLAASLDKKTIRAPFAGQLGVKQISIGQYVQPGDALVVLQALERVLVDFWLPQRELGQLRPGLTVRATSDADPGTAFEGRLSAIDPQVDPRTRNVRLQATFDNSERRLRAGMFVSVEVLLPETRTVLVIPATAVLYAPYGDTVFLLGDPAPGGAPGTWTVTQQIVRLGATRGDFVEVVDGLGGGERVISAGAFKLRNGQQVTLSDVGTLQPSAAPAPADA